MLRRKEFSMSSYRVLMVCTGNICRSPSAEGILRHMLVDAGLDRRVTVDSAGTSDFHQGETPSHLAVVAAGKRGYEFSDLRSRPLKAEDFTDFDLILAMDHGHMAKLKDRAPGNATAELAMFLSESPAVGRDDVPDPFYGGEAEYEYAFDLIETGCRDWVETLRGRVAAPA